MKFTKFITWTLILLCAMHLQAQVGAPSVKPSELSESSFFNDNSSSIPESRKKTFSNKQGDDSATLQALINNLSNQGGGIITIPAGTWGFSEIKIKSNIHLRFNPGAIVKPKLSTLNEKSIFIMGYNGANISNISICSTSDQFTIDMSDIPLNMRVLVFNIKELNNFKIVGCKVIDKWTVHSTVNCGVSKRNGVWAGAKNGLIKNLTVSNAHGGYGAVQVRVGERLLFKNISSIGGGATLRIETDAHETSGKQAPISITKISQISAYNIKCTNGNAAVMIQPWGIKNGWFDVDKVEATGCMAAVRIDRAYVDIDATNIGNFNPNSRITNITSKYGTNAQIKDGNIKSVPCNSRNLINSEPLPGMNGRWFSGPSIAPVLYTASSTNGTDPRYYSINIPSESSLRSKATNFPSGNLIISRWNNTNTNCSNTSENEFYIINRATGKKLKPNSAMDNANLIQVTASNNSNWTKWTKVSTGDGFYRIVNVQTGKYFAPIGTTDGAKLVQKPTSNNGSWTQWKEIASSTTGYVHLLNRGMEKYIRPVNNNVNALIEIRPTSWKENWTQWKMQAVSNTKAASTDTTTDNDSDLNIQVYPNPSQGIVNIQFNTKPETAIDISLISSSGKVVFTNSYHTTTSIQINTAKVVVKEKLYLVKIQYNNKTITKKLIIN